MTEEEKKAIERMTEVRDKKLHTFIDELTIVLNLIQKQNNRLAELEKENAELKAMLKTRIKYTRKLEQDLFENASHYVVPKAKIKEKIEEVEKMERTLFDIPVVCNMFKELLGEEI